MSENGSYLDWFCGDCGHEVISPEQPAPIRWTDCHICTFIRKQGACQPLEKRSYCTQNDGDCKTCSLVSYGRDCRNNPIN